MNLFLDYISSPYLKNKYSLSYSQIFWYVILPVLFALLPLFYNYLYISKWNTTTEIDDSITSIHVLFAYVWTASLFYFKILRSDLAKIMWLYGIIANIIVQFLWHIQGLEYWIGKLGLTNSYILWLFSFAIAMIIYLKSKLFKAFREF